MKTATMPAKPVLNKVRPAENARVHRIAAVRFDPTDGYVYRTGCGREFTSTSGAARTAFDVSCTVAGCA